MGKYYLLGLIVLLGCQQLPEPPQGPHYAALELEPFVIMAVSSPFYLSNDELKQVAILLTAGVEVYNRNELERYKRYSDSNPTAFFSKPRLIELAKYKKQLVISFNPKGEKIVGINAFRDYVDKHDKWQKEVISENDGGDCCFHTDINLSWNRWEYFQINSEA